MKDKKIIRQFVGYLGKVAARTFYVALVLNFPGLGSLENRLSALVIMFVLFS